MSVSPFPLPPSPLPFSLGACAYPRPSSGNSPASVPSSASTYEGLATPTETELSMSPISTSSQSSIGPGQIHEQWPSATMGQASGYDSYFPVAAAQPEHAVYHKTYHMN